MSDTDGGAEAADDADGADGADDDADEVDQADLSHLEDVGDGCGCEEVWAHTAASRGDSDPEDGANTG